MCRLVASLVLAAAAVAAAMPMMPPPAGALGPHDDGVAAAPLIHPPNGDLLLGGADPGGDWKQRLLEGTDARLQEQVCVCVCWLVD